MPDETLGHYRLLEKIGAGGMGEVYLARDERLEREVAIKVLPPGVLGESLAKRLRKEAAVLSKLTHPNIEILFDFGVKDGAEYLVVEYIPGVTLSEILSHGPLLEKDVARYGMQLASGLAAAHAQRVVHRDLKPANLRITTDGRLKILDFGIAKLMKAATVGGAAGSTTSTGGEHGMVGTLAYMAPEQLHNEPTDARTDIYAAGGVLYEMATGRRPFPDGPIPRLIDDILHTPPASPRALNPRLSAEMERIILKCMQKEPGNRYQSAADLEVDLRQLTAPRPLLRRARTSRWRSLGLPALLTLLIAATLFGMNVGGLRARWLPPAGPPEFQSLAVLPLDNLSGNPEQDYFADGMTEELITALAKISTLRVISRTSVMQYKGTHKPVSEIGRELKVGAVVEGSVQRSGNRVRITAQLIRTDTDRHLWAESYERDLRDVLSLRSEVATAIADQIRIKLTSQERARLAGTRPVNPEAYENYLKGRFYWYKRGPESVRSLDYFQRAITADPEYAPAYAGLADFYWSTDELPPAAAVPLARDYALKALKVDDTLAEAHTALALVKFYGDWDWSGAQDQFDLALQLNPNHAETHRIYSVFLSALGRSREALDEIRRAQELDPLAVTIKGTAGWTFYFARQYDDAVEQCRMGLELEPNSVGAHDCLGMAYAQKGMYEQALAECEAATRLSGNAPARAADLGMVYALAGKTAQARKVLGRLQALAGERYVSAYYSAMVYAALGEDDRALAALEKASQEHSLRLVWLRSEPAFDRLRGKPRFQTLLGQIHLPA